MSLLRAIPLLLVAAALHDIARHNAELAGDLLWACIITFSLLIAAGLGAPIPEELPIIGAGIWVGHNEEIGPLRWIILPVCILGVVISDGLLYGMGRFFGPRLLEKPWMQRLVPSDKRQKIESNFHRYGIWTLLFARFLPIIRSPIFITAGIMRLPLPRFLLADGLYAIPGVSLLFTLAFWFGAQFRVLVEHAEAKVDRLRPLVIVVAIAVAAGFLLYHFLRRPVSTGDPQELPLIGDRVAAKIEHLPIACDEHKPENNQAAEGPPTAESAPSLSRPDPTAD